MQLKWDIDEHDWRRTLEYLRVMPRGSEADRTRFVYSRLLSGAYQIEHRGDLLFPVASMRMYCELDDEDIDDGSMHWHYGSLPRVMSGMHSYMTSLEDDDPCEQFNFTDPLNTVTFWLRFKDGMVHLSQSVFKNDSWNDAFRDAHLLISRGDFIEGTTLALHEFASSVRSRAPEILTLESFAFLADY